MEVGPTIFEFTSYKFELSEKRIFFNYRIIFNKGKSLLFTETIDLPQTPLLNKIPKGLCEKVLQDTHLALGISYYKLYCSKKIRMSYFLTKEEAHFWNSFYERGLGEFFYRNKLNPSIFPIFGFAKDKKARSFRIEKNNRFLVGVSGGKDSIVAAELLTNYGANFSSFFVETQRPSPLTDEIIKIINEKLKTTATAIKIKRHLDEKLFAKELGYYFGHIPISGVYAFLGILAAVFCGYSYFVVANEFSSNFGNVRYKKRTINHQWSKSSEFEVLFQNHVRETISPDVYYFSLLRPFHEIRIAKMFAEMKKYFYSFSSCNNNFKINPDTSSSEKRGLWCGECPKCVFTFLILSPFLPKDELINIFGDNLFLNTSVLITLRDILGFGKIKPFDCIGTYQEARAAFYMSRNKFRDDLAGEIFLPKIDPDDNRYLFDYKKLPIKIYFQGKKDPKRLIGETNRAQNSLVPDHLKFLGMTSVLILGYGSEGKITKEYLRKNFPDIEIGIGDSKNDIHYLGKQKNFDIAVRSPGVPKEYLKIPHTTATNIFFSHTRQMPGVKIIGVTGTKGKSTTATLIHHILKQSGKRAELLGNIGKPMLSALMREVGKNTIFVLELSSYQLDDIKFSPDIAVITSLFPEHMNYHLNIKNYYAAKKNILKYQEADNYFIFDNDNKRVAKWTKFTKAKSVPFAPIKFLENMHLPLLGEHNKDNIRAAIAATRCLNIKDNIIRKAIESFEPLPHRLEFIGEYKGIKFYNDAVSTTPESTIMALKSLPKVGTIFLGGQDRGYNFSKLRAAIKKYYIKNLVLFPDSGKKIIRSRRGLNILDADNMEDAVKFAFKNTSNGEICLLSCASPSYSLWKNFEEKGDQFKFWVKYFGENEGSL